jgi:type VI secretion system secreted protein VgrG
MITSEEHAGFTVSVASGDALDARDFTIHERMSALFSVTVTVVAHDADLDFEAIVGRPASFEVHAGPERRRTWTGICKELLQVAAEETGLSTYKLEIVPALWLATQRRNHRIFQGVSDVDIAVALMAEWGVSPVQKLSGTYKKRKYRVQYGESDFAFICRLLEDAGASFYFAEDAGETVLVLSDAPHANEAREPLIPFRDHPSDADREHVTAVRVGRRLRPGRYVMRDHDYRRPPSFKLMGTAALAQGVEELLEEFHYAPGAFLFESANGDPTPHADDRGRYRADPAEGEAVARRRLEAKRSEVLTCAFETNAIDLAPGVVFGMRWHPQRELGEDRRLLVVAATMSGTTGARWKHACEARSTAVPFRPAVVTPKPEVHGVESATVVGPPGEEIHTDEFGRVRVHFHWDRESRMDDTSSCWMHVSQPWGGAMYGGINLPRVGQEVLVDFLGGDPDRPVIVGRVFTNLQRVPYKLPENRTQSGWKSASTGGTGGYNEIMFEDAAGKELVRVQAERDLQKLVKNDERVTIGHNRSTYVRAIDATTVGDTHVVMIAPPGEGGPATSSSITMTDKKIVLDTGAGATITLDHDRITIEADDLVEIWGKKRGVNLHAPAPGGKTNFFSGDSFTVATQTIVMTGENVSITALDELKLEGTGSAALTSDGTLKLGGASSAELTSSGPTSVNGTPVQLNGPGLFAGRVTEQAPATITTGAALVLVGGASFPLPVVAEGDNLKVGNNITIKNDPADPTFKSKVLRDLGIMASTDTGRARLNSINGASKSVTINHLSGTTGGGGVTSWGAGGSDGSGSNATVGYNPDYSPPNSLDPAHPKPADANLFHELTHADHAMHGNAASTAPVPGSVWDNQEDQNTIAGGSAAQGPSENDYLRDRGYPYKRIDHHGGFEKR